MVLFAIQIMFQNVRIAELPKAVFPSAVAEIRMDDIWTKIIRKDAFCAMTIFSVVISNASIHEIQSGAFSDRALIHSLEFVDVQLKNINTAAFRAGHDNLTIQYSRFEILNSLHKDLYRGNSSRKIKNRDRYLFR